MLKKFIFTMFITVLFLTCVHASTTTDSFKRTFIGEFSYVDKDNHWGNFEFFKRNSDNQVAYCIQPGVSFYQGELDGYFDLTVNELASKVSLSKEMLNKITRIAYFGWGYNGRSGNEWFVATQALIWKALGRDFTFTSRINEADPWKYAIDTPKSIEEKMNEIERLVNNYETSSAFDSNHARIGLNSSHTFASQNSLSDYSITNCKNCSATIRDNNLIVTPSGKSSGSVNLKKEIKDWSTSFVVYASSKGQNILVPGNVEPLNSQVTFEVISGSFKLKKYDMDNKSCKPKEGGSLKGSIYKLYKANGTFVSDLTIDENCTAEISNLEMGSYYIKEYKAGLHYELDEKNYSFTLSLEKPKKELVVYDKMYLGQIELLKADSKTNTCNSTSLFASLNGAIYGIYKEDETLIDKITIDKNCKALSKRNLLLGDYYVQEIKAPKGYKLDLKKHFFSVTKENADGLITLNVYDEIYETNLILNKQFLKLNQIYPEAEAKFEIYAKTIKIETVKTDKDGIAKLNLPYGEYTIKQVQGKEGYHFVEDITFIVDEKVKENSYLTLLNQPFRGKLELVKKDAASGKLLKGAWIEIYTEDEELIYQGKTDDEGKLFLDNIEYGKYYLIEKEAPKGYALKEEKIPFEIKEEEETIYITLTNEQLVRVPNTSKNRNKVETIFIMLTTMIGMGYLVCNKRNG